MKKLNGFTKGVNLGGWLSQCDYSEERLDNFITLEDVKKISSWGADHVRLPIDYNIIQNENGEIKPDGFRHIDGALEMCDKCGLNTVVDLHKTIGFSFDRDEKQEGFFDSEKLQGCFYRLWEELAARYGNSGRIAFELLNEITDRGFSEKWNVIARNCVKKIRAVTENTLILVGSYWNNSVSAVKDLDPPYDENIAYNFHCYDPMPFTHQGAAWVYDTECSKSVKYGETDWSAEDFISSFREAAETAEKYDTALYCGEYGVIDNASPEDTLSWYRDINSAFEHYGMSRCAWTYKEMDFGLSDQRMKGVIGELVKYL